MNHPFPLTPSTQVLSSSQVVGSYLTEGTEKLDTPTEHRRSIIIQDNCFPESVSMSHQATERRKARLLPAAAIIYAETRNKYESVHIAFELERLIEENL